MSFIYAKSNAESDPHLRHFSEELVVIGLLEVHLVVDGISHLSLIPLLLR